MIKIKPLKGSLILKFLGIAVFLLICSFIKEASLLHTITLLLWLFLLLFSLEDINKNISLFCFLVSFFVFLLGREFCYTFFDVDISYFAYTYLTPFNDFAFLCIIISLFCIGFGYCFLFSGENINGKINNDILDLDSMRNLRLFLKKYFFFCYIFLMIGLVLNIVLVFTVGYLGTYLITERSDNIILNLISYIGAFTPIVFCLYLGTKPERADAFFPIISFEIYGILSLLSGRRFTFVGTSMLILMYLVIRNREESGWITKRLKNMVLLSIPFLLIFLGAYDIIRLGQDYDFSNVADALFRFFDGQGGSINVIKRVKYYESSLVDLSFCSLSNLRALLFENLLVRNITGTVVLGGNSVEHALSGNSLSHRLSLYEYGNAYLAGRGVGSCYIAELYHDFGYIGICIGSVFYGYLIRIVGVDKGNDFFKNGISLIIMYYLLHAPRASFDEFVRNVFGLYALIGYVIIWIVYSLRRAHLSKDL